MPEWLQYLMSKLSAVNARAQNPFVDPQMSQPQAPANEQFIPLPRPDPRQPRLERRDYGYPPVKVLPPG